ncbi:YkvA family protein [Streptosporangium sp. CA-135522]|uniref:YkvA family protein n=1 Tax=Streptosporangium sp. CA-135522 TaxID=3240072 RepID=UPI003D916BEA
MNPWWSIALALFGGLVLLWLVALAALALVRPRGNLLTEAIRLLPDLLRLVHRLARDRSLPRGVRVRLWLLLAYLALPIDLVPDFIPVLGYADDAIAVAVVLRSVIGHAGPDALIRHWPGTDDGLAAVRRLAGLPAAPDR